MTTTRKEAERAARKQYVLDATRDLLTRFGVEQVSMEEIAAAVDYTRRTLYAYFNSRDEILLMALTQSMAERWAYQQEAVSSARTGLAKILGWGEALFAYDRENRHALELEAYWDYRGLDREGIGEEAFTAFEKINNELAEGLRGYFRLGVSDRSLRRGLDIDMCISQYLYSLRAVIHRALVGTYSFASFDSEAYFHNYLELFSRAIRNPRGKDR